MGAQGVIRGVLFALLEGLLVKVDVIEQGFDKGLTRLPSNEARQSIHVDLCSRANLNSNFSLFILNDLHPIMCNGVLKCGPCAAKHRNYRKEYLDYYGRPGRVSKKQFMHRLHKSSRNKARKLMLNKYGKKRLQGMDVDHKNRNPLDNSKGNLRIQKVSVNRANKK